MDRRVPAGPAVGQSQYESIEFEEQALRALQNHGLSIDDAKLIVQSPDGSRDGDSEGELVSLREMIGRSIQVIHHPAHSKRRQVTPEAEVTDLTTVVKRVIVREGADIKPHPTIAKMRGLHNI